MIGEINTLPDKHKDLKILTITASGGWTRIHYRIFVQDILK